MIWRIALVIVAVWFLATWDPTPEPSIHDVSNPGFTYVGTP